MRVLVVDDEQPARVRLTALVSEIAGYELCGEASNGIEALDQVQNTRPDIVLMDIMMPHMNGLEAARHMTKLAAPPAVIFTTAYDEHALAAFEANASAYLLKPVRKERLIQVLADVRALNRAQLASLEEDNPEAAEQRSHICAKLGMRLELIPIEDIFYFQADQKYVTVRHSGGEAVIEDSLKSLEQEWHPKFLRIHRNALVSTEYIAGLEKTSAERYQVSFKTVPDRLEVSRRHVAAVRRFLRTH